MSSRAVDVAVVGGGLAGLTAALYAARDGAQVHVFERSQHLGGRARTRSDGGFRFNLGPHALYRGGGAARILSELRIECSASAPAVDGGFAVKSGRLHPLPVSPASLLKTGAVGLRGKLQLAGFLNSLKDGNPADLEGLTVADWIGRQLSDPGAQMVARALVRLATYTNAPSVQCAAAALQQLQVSLAGVLYLDGGWQSMVDRLSARAEEMGVHIETESHVNGVDAETAGFRVHQKDRDPIEAGAVIFATPPDVAGRLIGSAAGSKLLDWTSQAGPVRAACLDLGLRSLPSPRRLFALGLDAPLYYSVHSAVANLAPEGRALIHVAKYRDGSSPHDDRRELEALMDLLQPGWRHLVEVEQYLPSLTVTYTIRAGSGLSGRPGPALADAPGMFVAGDWAGPHGQLADAALTSARAAGSLAAEYARLRPHVLMTA
jgi:phytoene dehydrogenase-like protein